MTGYQYQPNQPITIEMIPSFSNCSPVFTVNAPPGTDYWRKPPNTDIRNGAWLVFRLP